MKTRAGARVGVADLVEVRAELLGDDGADVFQHLLLVLQAPGPSGSDSFLARSCLIGAMGPLAAAYHCTRCETREALRPRRWSRQWSSRAE